MKDIWKKYKLLITSFIYLIIIFLLFVFVVSPLIDNVKKNSDDIERGKIDNEINRERISKLPEMKDGYAAFEQEKNNLEVVLDQNNSVDFIKKMELLAEETGNKISLTIEDNFDASKSAKSAKNEKSDADDIRAGLPSNKYLLMKLSLEGTYDGLTRFLYRLENMDYYVNVISLNMSKETVESEQKSAIMNKENEIIEKNILVSELEIAVYTK